MQTTMHSVTHGDEKPSLYVGQQPGWSDEHAHYTPTTVHFDHGYYQVPLHHWQHTWESASEQHSFSSDNIAVTEWLAQPAIQADSQTTCSSEYELSGHSNCTTACFSGSQSPARVQGSLSSFSTTVSSRPSSPGSTYIEPTSIREVPETRHDNRNTDAIQPAANRRTATTTTTTTTTRKGRRVQKIAHRKVERKYRENLKSELSRLRQAIPILPSYESEVGCSAVKLSKAMVLVSAVEYIKVVEGERDALLAEIKQMRSTKRNRR